MQAPTVIIPDADLPLPVPEIIDWKTPEEVLKIGRDNPNICAMVYFPDVIDGGKDMEEVLPDPELVKLINKTFVSIRFPVTEKNLSLVMKEFQLESLPVLMFSPPNDSMVLRINGTPPAKKILKTLVELTKENALFAECAAIKAAGLMMLLESN